VIAYLFPIIAVLAVAYSYDRSSQENVRLCDHEYALCTSAPCIPQSDDPSKAICICDVKKGKNMSTVSCDTLKPSTDANGIRTVFSTFSLEQFQEGKKTMKCPAGTPWTWCLNKRCTVDPAHSDKAMCVCDVMRSGQWLTLGGNCDAATCTTGYWSGATVEAFEHDNAFVIKELGLNASIVKWCEAK
jgi:hypothetical protein